MENPKWRKGKYTDGPNESKFYSSGIDAQFLDGQGNPDWHFHAIEFHHKDKAEAERLRDFAFARLTAPVVGWRIAPHDTLFLLGETITDKEEIAAKWREAGCVVQEIFADEIEEVKK